MCNNRGSVVTRKDFLRASLALAAVPLLRSVPAYAAAPSSDSVELSEIAPGVFVHQGRVEMQSPENEGDMANAGFVVGSIWTRTSPIWFFDISATVSGFRSWLPLPLPPFRIIRMKRW